MNADKRAALTALLAGLAPFIPGAAPYAAAIAAIAPALRSLFAGSDAAEFDAIMAEARAGIDKLAHPDQFRHAPPAVAPRPPGTRRYEVTLDARPKGDDYGAGDVAYQHGADDLFLVRQRGVGIGALPEPWHETEFA